MKKTPLAVAGIATAVVLGGGSSAFAMTHEVHVNAYGKHRSVRILSGTVGDVLAGQDVTVKPSDKVSPGLDSAVHDGMQITVQHQRPITATINGATTSRMTTARTVGQALTEMGVDLSRAKLSVPASTTLDAKGTTVNVTVSSVVTFSGQYGKADFTVTEPTVGEAAQAHLYNTQPGDKFYDASGREIPASTPVTQGMAVRIARIRTTTTTDEQKIPFTSSTVKDANAPEGSRKVSTKGVLGVKRVTTVTTTIDGKVTDEKRSEKVLTAPVNEVVAVGTKPAPKPVATEKPKPTASAQEQKKAPAPKPSRPSKAATPSAPKKQSSGGRAVGGVNTCGASFYHEGQMTASGERFNPNAMTAAHKTLPLGTRIRVTNPANGRSVVVRINDRGPYIGGRCLDLSRAAFAAIGNTSSGTMRVTWQRLG